MVSTESVLSRSRNDDILSIMIKDKGIPTKACWGGDCYPEDLCRCKDHVTVFAINNTNINNNNVNCGPVSPSPSPPPLPCPAGTTSCNFAQQLCCETEGQCCIAEGSHPFCCRFGFICTGGSEVPCTCPSGQSVCGGFCCERGRCCGNCCCPMNTVCRSGQCVGV